VGGDDETAGRAGWYLVLFGAVAGAVASLTMLFRSMRSVLEIGGSCASGGPYAVARPCPKGIAAITPLSIWVGIGFVALAAVAAMRLKVPSVAWLAWPALFLSLGWNFWEFGLDPPGGGGVAWGWIVCGALFVLMGGGPLLAAFGWARHGGAGAPAPPTSAAARATARAAAAGTAVRRATTPPPFRDDDLVGRLERLAALHRSGALDDAQYESAKRSILEGDTR
jgi:hypothetical protein